jgi:hypothetical protein
MLFYQMTAVLSSTIIDFLVSWSAHIDLQYFWEKQD